MKRTLKIATRKSQLALWQANWVKSVLEKKFPSTPVELVIIKTQGDILGMFADATFGIKKIAVNQGDRFFIYSDGLVESSEKTKPKSSVLKNEMKKLNLPF